MEKYANLNSQADNRIVRGPTPTAKQSLAAAIERTTELNGRLNQLATDAERQAARFAGERPTPSGVRENDTGSLNGQVAMLHTALDVAFDLSDRLRYAINRLDEV